MKGDDKKREKRRGEKAAWVLIQLARGHSLTEDAGNKKKELNRIFNLGLPSFVPRYYGSLVAR